MISDSVDVFDGDGNDGFVDFSECKVIVKSLTGVSQKMVVLYNGEEWMLKFPKEKLGIFIPDHVTEYLACTIAFGLGYEVQKTKVGFYNGNECVAIKLFDTPITFEGLGDSTRDNIDFEYNLDWLLGLPINYKYGITREEYLRWVIKVFTLDMFIGNFDRHENNWGFHRIKGKYYPSPLYDLGASFYPRYFNEDINKLSDGEIKNIITHQTKSAIIYQDKKRNYFDLMNIIKSEYLIECVSDIVNKSKLLDYDKILNTVIKYNNDYSNYIFFIKRTLVMKTKLLESWLANAQNN